MKTYKKKIHKPIFTQAIYDHVVSNCSTLFIPACMKYKAIITLNGYEYAAVKDTKEEAVKALAERCAKSDKLKTNWINPQQ